MTVYFIHKVSDRSEIKIGSTNDIPTRLRTHAKSFGDIRLFAQCPGGVEVERLYQKAFSHLRTEGEWFRASIELWEFIEANAEKVDVLFSQRGQAWTRKSPSNRADEDALLAASLLIKCISAYPATTTVAAAQESVFQALHQTNKAWTRRRVRAVYEGGARRIDLFEVIDLFVLADIPKSDWGEILLGEDRAKKWADRAEWIGKDEK